MVTPDQVEIPRRENADDGVNPLVSVWRVIATPAISRGYLYDGPNLKEHRSILYFHQDSGKFRPVGFIRRSVRAGVVFRPFRDDLREAAREPGELGGGHRATIRTTSTVAASTAARQKGERNQAIAAPGCVVILIPSPR